MRVTPRGFALSASGRTDESGKTGAWIVDCARKLVLHSSFMTAAMDIFQA